jgi:hypothetical protein
MKGDFRPVIQEDVIFRPQDQLQLFTNEIIDSTVHRMSDSVVCAPFRKFGLYCHVEFDGTPDTITLQIKVEFLDPWTGQWYKHKQGLFAALFYEDTDTANGIWECFTGDVLGRAMRVRLVGTGVSAANHFHVDIGVDFWN